MSIREKVDRVDSRIERGEGLQRFVPAALVLALVATLISGCHKGEKAAPPVPTVEVAQVTQMDVPVYAEWVGSLDGMVNATIRAQVQGYLVKQSYQEGAPVKKGQVLFEIDPRTFQATYNKARADVVSAQARWDQTKANLNRIRPLAAQNAVSQKDLDDAVASEASASASVLAAKAAFDKASLDLGFTRITSPIDGIAGIAKAQLGNLVGPGQIEELTTVSSVDPIKCYVSVSEQEYLKLLDIRTQIVKEKLGKVPLELILANGAVFPHKGEVLFADRQVDERTGTMKIAATFPNPDGVLRPGQFARVRALMKVKAGAMVVPQRAVKEVQGKYLVALVGEGDKVSVKEVEVAEKFGPFFVVEKGLQTGDKVVAEGVMKVKDGAQVKTKPFDIESLTKPAQGQNAGAEPEKAKKQGAESEKAKEQGAEPAAQPKPDKVGTHG